MSDTEITTPMAWSPSAVNVLTLFVDDLAETREFYERVFGLRVVYSDADSAVFTVGTTLVNLLRADAAEEVIAPAEVHTGTAARAMYTISVEDVNAICEMLLSRGVKLLNGPIDRPWGVRTASFCDPAGHIWELAQHL